MKVINSYKIHNLVKKINEALDPELENRLRKDLKKYCEETGKSYSDICKLAGLDTKGFGALPSEVINFIDKKSSGPWHYDEKTGRINIKGDFYASGSYSYEKRDALDVINKMRFGKIEGNFTFNYFDLSDENWEIICPLEVEGNLDISRNSITKLILPSKMGGSIYINRNDIESLEGCPEICEGDFVCDENKLPNLEGGPKEVKGAYACSSQKTSNLSSPFTLTGCAQKIGKDFVCKGNYLKNLEGGPAEVGGGIDLRQNDLLDLKGCFKKVMSNEGYDQIRVEYNKLATLEGLPLGISLHRIECSKNLMQPKVMKEVYRDATSMKSWIAAYLKLAATQRFKRMGKAERDPIVARITPELIAKNPVALAPIWKDEELLNDPVIKRRIKQSGITKDDAFKKDIELSSDLLDLGF